MILFFNLLLMAILSATMFTDSGDSQKLIILLLIQVWCYCTAISIQVQKTFYGLMGAQTTYFTQLARMLSDKEEPSYTQAAKEMKDQFAKNERESAILGKAAAAMGVVSFLWMTLLLFRQWL